MRRPDSLWDQYLGKACAEARRGTGIWPLQPWSCALEPPWDEFDRHSVSLWDCIFTGWEAPWEGSWFRRMFSSQKPFLPDGQPVILPEFPYSDWGSLQPVVLEQFPDDESTIPKAEEFLRAVSHVTRPVSFEIIGVGPQAKYDSEKGLEILKDQAAGKKRKLSEAICGWSEPFSVLQFVAHPDDAPRIERLLLAHFPNSSVVRGEELNWDYDHISLNDIRYDRAFATTLALEYFICWPIRAYTRLDPDPLGVAIAAMENLGNNEWALLQILFEPATAPWAETISDAVTHPYKRNEFLLPDLDGRILREKFASPLFAVAVRIAASTKDVFRQLEGWAAQFATPPQRFVGYHSESNDGKMSDDERDALGAAIDNRLAQRPGFLLNVEELSSLIHLPGRAVMSERLRRVKTRTKAATEVPAEAGSVLLGDNVHRGKTRQARIPPALRARHCYLAGASGTGKSTLLINMIMQDIQSGQGVACLDPHGDLIADVLKRIPPHRVDDVILFDPSDEDFPFALNILEAKDESERERIVNETVMAMKRFFPASWGPRLQQLLTMSLFTALEGIPGATLADVERFLTVPHFRDDVVAKVKDPRFVEFWQYQYGHMPKNAADPVLNKLSVFLVNKTVRNIICQRRSAIDFDRLLNDGKILLANLSTGLLTEEIAGTFGSFLVTKIVNAAFRRSRLPENKRRPFYLYVDEFQNFMSTGIGFERILAEARKYKLVLAGIASQYAGQLSTEVRQAIYGNVGTMVVFRLGVDDAHSVAREMGVFTAEEILNLDMGQAIVRAGKSSATFNLQTYPAPPLEASDPTDRIRKQVRNHFARRRSEVDSMFRGPAAAQKKPSAKPPKKGPDPTDPNEDDLVQ